MDHVQTKVVRKVCPIGHWGEFAASQISGNPYTRHRGFPYTSSEMDLSEGAAMTNSNLSHNSSLRLPNSTRRKASELAELEGISLNDFILFAVAEKLVRLESAISADFIRKASQPISGRQGLQ